QITGLKGNSDKTTGRRFLNTQRKDIDDPLDNASMSLWISEFAGGNLLSYTNTGGIAGKRIAGSLVGSNYRFTTMHNASTALSETTPPYPFGVISRHSMDEYIKRAGRENYTVQVTATGRASGNIGVFRQGNHNLLNETFSAARISFYHIGES